MIINTCCKCDFIGKDEDLAVRTYNEPTWVGDRYEDRLLNEYCCPMCGSTDFIEEKLEEEEENE